MSEQDLEKKSGQMAANESDDVEAHKKKTPMASTEPTGDESKREGDDDFEAHKKQAL